MSKAGIIPGRQTATPQKPLALFLIGMRVNNLLAVPKWGQVFLAMPRMMAELKQKPEAGLLWHRNFISGRTSLMLQYWESHEKLFAYAHDRDGSHFPAWAAFNRKLKDNQAVGIWHETYLVTPETAENIYSNMPAFGLGAALGVAPAKGRMGGMRDPFSGP
jgi:Domain of unknown function (DUF4188)